MIDILDEFISRMDLILNNKSKRHMVGGILLSTAMLFGGLAITVVTMHVEENINEKN